MADVLGLPVSQECPCLPECLRAKCQPHLDTLEEVSWASGLLLVVRGLLLAPTQELWETQKQSGQLRTAAGECLYW